KKDAERRKIEKEIAKLEEEILSLEEKKSELDAKMADPSVYSNGEKAKAVQKQIEEIAQKIEVATAAWEQASENLELIL
ncbi:MAG: ABC transporter ATP-binding protein, partial [Treponema bryantii]|nr:ABC transporter ATP-binding protein [Treponema bryantii]